MEGKTTVATEIKSCSGYRVLRYTKSDWHLFSAQATLEHIRLEDAEIYYLRKLPLAQPAEALTNQLIDGLLGAPKISCVGKNDSSARLR